jgi:hypothetical protein
MSMQSQIKWLSKPALRHPAVIAAFSGWNDAGDAASGALQRLVEVWDAQPLAELDPELFTDFATIRPHVQLLDGRTRSIRWPMVKAWWASTPGCDVILILGPEPSLRWRMFTDQVLSIAEKFDSSMFITLGALLADVPHTRPVQLVGTASDDDMIERFSLQRSQYAASLWAAVPAYASQIPSPRAAIALITRACEIIGTPAPIGGLWDEIGDYDARVSDLIDENDDLAPYVERLEQMTDAEIEDEEGDAIALADDDSGELLIEELEQFLRDQDER